MNGDIVEVYDAGYQGYGSVPASIRQAITADLGDVRVSPSEYRRILKTGNTK